MVQKSNEKATRYLAELDKARCTGRWTELPELARKVEKHAPHRACLALTARTEAKVASQSDGRPSTATAGPSKSQLEALITPLQAACEKESEFPQDAYEGRICIAWIHWIVGDLAKATEELPPELPPNVKQTLDDMPAVGQRSSQWVYACAVKGAYIKGHSLEAASRHAEALQMYSSLLSLFAGSPSRVAATPQFCIWSELVINRLCNISMQTEPLDPRLDVATMLEMFRIWNTLWSHGVQKQPAPRPEKGVGKQYSRLEIWRSYYRTLSEMLNRGLLFSPASSELKPVFLTSSEEITEDQIAASRLKHRREIKEVESIVCTMLFNNTKFPMANETNQAVEDWVADVMKSWRVMCGPTWRDDDLGEGGKDAVSRGVLDILYNSATKTFHSTMILRQMFTVHAALAEFDLALKAFDSYVEIVTRSKDRAEKSGQVDETLDDDGTVLRTAAEAINVLCRFGSRAEGEKARQIGSTIEKWLKQHTPASQTSNEDSDDTTETAVPPQALAVAYRAIGISSANWAKLTYEAETRAGLQAQAIQSFRKALDPALGESKNMETLYSLGLVLADMRDVAGALKVIKEAISSTASLTADSASSGSAEEWTKTAYARERKLLPIWHLLALLLSARSDFDTSAKSCEAAFEQFHNPTILFGDASPSSPLSPHLQEMKAASEKTLAGSSRGLVDNMDDFEKESVLQIKITQMALLESMEGPSAAVDACDELLALYSRLFGNLKPNRPTTQQSTLKVPPKSATGTIRGSIFGRNKSRRSMMEKTNSVVSSSTAAASRPSSSAGTEIPSVPMVEVTDEDAAANGHGHRHLHIGRHSSRHESKLDRAESKLHRKSIGSMKKKENMSLPVRPNEASEPTVPEPSSPNTASRSSYEDAPETLHRPAPTAGEDNQPDRKLPPIPHNISHTEEPPPLGHEKQPPQQDVRLPGSVVPSNEAGPQAKLPNLQERRHKTTLLIDTWLFAAGLYTRAELFEDARGAINEGFKLVEEFELEVSRLSSTARAFAETGWGGGKSVEEMWADIYATRGYLAQACNAPHEAITNFEKALSHFPDHASAIVGLSDLLLDIYTQKIPPEAPSFIGIASSSSISIANTIAPTASMPPTQHELPSTSIDSPSKRNPNADPEELNRLAARDRAYNLLSTLTKLGTGWDYSEAWYTLARAYEEGGQLDKAKSVLWWCVELEDTRPVRPWGTVGVGRFVL
ncbi:hypothetical protein K402DRAFT_396640 [Aulographum hederae CBS 113979]|uniref:Filamentation protein-like protein n=1 Tax=Aulographum hederae CBS 113979 TaxID=1176131 RepID=A0A6G1GR39_9PEZI|nr:hypothetical protein K402DRAFT_396640 [Aulographum hederae CBS 113979]